MLAVTVRITAVERFVEKTFAFQYKTEFRGENFRGLLWSNYYVWVWLQKFADKMFTDGSETAKNEKVFSLESFPLTVFYYNYSNNNYIY